MTYKLAEKNQLQDVSWIKPGQVSWEWWNDASPYGPDVDFVSGYNLDTYKYYIDFALSLIHISLEDIEGVSAKGGGNGDVTIFYSTRHIEKSFAKNDTAKLFFETRGVLLHELTHAYQLEPQGIGSYGTNRVFWAFIEGMADAVRVRCV